MIVSKIIVVTDCFFCTLVLLVLWSNFVFQTRYFRDICANTAQKIRIRLNYDLENILKKPLRANIYELCYQIVIKTI